MRLCVLAAQPRRLDPRVDLSRRDTRVSQKLLDRAQVRPALEQMGRERVAQRVRRNAARRPPPRAPTCSSRRRTSDGDEPPPAAAEEQRGSSRAAPSAWRATSQIAAQRALSGLADRHDPRLRALAGDADGLGVEVDVAEVERDDLLGAQAAGVGELEQGTVADLERGRAAGIRSSSRGDLVAGRAPAAGASRASGLAAGRPGFAAAPPAHQMRVKPAHGGELAGDARPAPAGARRARPRSRAGRGRRARPAPRPLRRRPGGKLEQVAADRRGACAGDAPRGRARARSRRVTACHAGLSSSSSAGVAWQRSVRLMAARFAARARDACRARPALRCWTDQPM